MLTLQPSFHYPIVQIELKDLTTREDGSHQEQTVLMPALRHLVPARDLSSSAGGHIQQGHHLPDWVAKTILEA